jgi:hypothetical protein
MHPNTEDKSDETVNSFYKELECVFFQFPNYPMNIFLGDFSANVGREDMFKPAIRNEFA